MKLKMLTKGYLLPGVFLLMLSASCKKEVYTSEVFIVKQWKVDLSAANVVPAISSRTDHAVALLFLMSNNELHYNIYFDVAVQNNDTPSKGQLYLGATGNSGAVFLDLQTPAFNSQRETEGSVALNAATVSSIKTDKIYLQVNSVQQSGGLVRGQLN